MIRFPAFANSFYPGDSIELKRMITKFFNSITVEDETPLGCVVPHAGYAFSGKTASYVYKSLSKKMEKKTFIILGVDHAGLSAGASLMPNGSWQTPLGNVKIDENAANELLNSSDLFRDDPNAHRFEHSIEVQLPFLQYRFNNFKIVPVSLSSFLDTEATREIAKTLPDDCYVIATSDLTHYGRNYGYVPFSGGRMDIIAQMRKMDKKIISSVTSLNSKSFSEFVKNTGNTTCGTIPITVVIEAMKRFGCHGKLLNYSTSFDVTKDISAIVGYAGIIFK